LSVSMIWLSVNFDFFMAWNSSTRKFYFWSRRFCRGDYP